MAVLLAVVLSADAQEQERPPKPAPQPVDRRDIALDRGRRAGRRRRYTRPQNPFQDLGTLELAEQALFAMAQILYEKEDYQATVEELARVAAESPDDHARSGAHLVAGHIYREKLGDTTKAIEQYKQVTGDRAPRALKAMVKCYEEIGRPDSAAAALEERLLQAATALEKAMILNEIANVYRRANDPDKAIDTLRRIPQTITYE